jgi:hypothetical protein
LAGSINQRNPAGTGGRRGQHERNLLVMSVHEQQEIVIVDGLATFIDFVRYLPAQ